VLSVVLLGDTASRLHRQGVRAERRGKDVEAFSLFSQAAGLRPLEAKYRQAAARLRQRALQTMAAWESPPSDLDSEPLPEEEDGEEPAGEESPTSVEIREAERAAEPIVLTPDAGTHTFDLRGDARALWEPVARAYGITVVFDADLPGGQAVRFRLENAGFRDAARALMALTNTFLVPLNTRAAMAAADTQAKRTELEPAIAALLPIPQVMSVEEANEVGRAVQQALDIKRLSVDATRRQVYVRDTVARVLAAKALYQELSRPRAEVILDIDLVSASRTGLVNLGLTLPTSFPVSGPAGRPLNQLAAGASLFGVAIGDSAFQADWSRSHAQLVSRVRLRAIDGLAANLHVGDKFPIVNAIFSPIVITDQIRDLERRGELRPPFPSFTFEDLGLVLKVTPRVHDSREVSLTVEAEFRVLAGTSLNGLPVISSRKFSSSVRLREGQAGLVSGLAVVQSSLAASGLGPLVLAPLASRSTRDKNDNELLLTITPRLSRLPPAEQREQKSFHFGSETRNDLILYP